MAVALGNSHLLAMHLGRLKGRGGVKPEQISLGKVEQRARGTGDRARCRTILGAKRITLECRGDPAANNLEIGPHLRAPRRCTS